MGEALCVRGGRVLLGQCVTGSVGFVSTRTQKLCGDAADDRSRGEALGDHGIGTDDAIGSEFDTLEDTATFAEPAAFANNDGTRDELPRGPGHHVVVIGDVDSSCDQHAWGDFDELRCGDMEMKLDGGLFADFDPADFSTRFDAFKARVRANVHVVFDVNSTVIGDQFRPFDEGRVAIGAELLAISLPGPPMSPAFSNSHALVPLERLRPESGTLAKQCMGRKGRGAAEIHVSAGASPVGEWRGLGHDLDSEGSLWPWVWPA